MVDEGPAFAVDVVSLFPFPLLARFSPWCSSCEVFFLPNRLESCPPYEEEKVA